MKLNIKIKGTHCMSCKTLIENELKEEKGVDKVNVNYKTGYTNLEFNEKEITEKQILTIIENLGYNQKEKKGKLSDWIYALIIVGVLYGIYLFLRNLGVMNFLDNGSDGVGYGVAFLTGIAASLSSCLAIVGAVVISFGSQYRSTETGFFHRNIKPHLLFQSGRITSFFILGGILGLIGGVFTLSNTILAIFTIIIGIILLWLGLSTLGLINGLNLLGSKNAGGLVKRMQKSDSKMMPLLLGAITFFLPCGFTQSMQVLALSSGNFIEGALILLFFVLGTLPVLMFIGITSSHIKNTRLTFIKKAIGMIIILFAIYTFLTALGQLGVTLSLDKGDIAQKQSNEQIIEMDISYRGYSPSTFRLEKGVPVRWVINGEQVSGCTNEIMVPSLGIKEPIKKGENIIEFTPTKTGTIGFSCWMGMVRGKFIVE